MNKRYPLPHIRQRLLILVGLLFFYPYQSGSACTIGAFTAAVMSEGRAVLWKNRDVNNPDQAMKFLRGKRFAYITNVYAGETENAWAGINEAGFAIMNSNSYNLSGYSDGADDGNIMALALGTCATVDDFARLLDSFNIVGRETPANYGVFDNLGNVAIFEASHTYYTRCDVRADSLGFLLRANYSMSGGPSRLLGKNRYQRAMALCLPAKRENRLSIEFLIQTLARDLGQVDFDPYPLPFTRTLPPLPRGYLPTDTTISRATTRSVEIIVAPAPGASPASGMIWVLLGEPIASLPVPLWLSAETVPGAMDGKITAPLCDEAQKLTRYLYSDPNFPKAVNTFRLARWLEHIAPVESTIFATVREKEAQWGLSGPPPESARALTESICQLVLNTYQEFWKNIDLEMLPLALKSIVLPSPGTAGRLPAPGFTLYDPLGRRVTHKPKSAGIFFLYNGRTRQRLVVLKTI